MLGNQSVVVINCADFEGMKAFYKNRIDLKVMHETNASVVFDTGEGGELVLTNKPEPPSIMVGFTGVNIHAAHETLNDLGPTEPMPHKNGQRFMVKDPDGNTLSFVDD